jgi:hypothetical protein
LDLKDQIRQFGSEAVARLRVKSALNPILWLCGIISLPGLVLLGSSNVQPPAFYVIACIVCLPVILACGGYLFFLMKDPDKLQSEDYQLRKRSLELIQEKGQRFPVEPASIQLITNPDFPKELKE